MKKLIFRIKAVFLTAVIVLTTMFLPYFWGELLYAPMESVLITWLHGFGAMFLFLAMCVFSGVVYGAVCEYLRGDQTEVTGVD